MADFLYELKLHDPSTGMVGYIAIKDLVNGIAGGGLRVGSGVSLGEVKRLAEVMSKKWMTMGIGFGGAKAGIKAMAKAHNKRELLTSFARLAKPLLSSIFFTGPDMGTTHDEVELVFKEAGVDTITFVRDKLRERGVEVNLPEGTKLSSIGGEGITGWGVASATEEACRVLALDLAGMRVAIQGFGAVGSSAARYLAEKGARVVAVADRLGTIFSGDGLDVDLLKSATDELGDMDRNKLKQTTSYQMLPGEDWLKTEAEILIPAAVADAISQENVRRVGARLVVEAANIPITEEAKEVLRERGTRVVPDYIANAGLACGFGLVMTGQTSCNGTEVFDEVSLRIRRATRELLEGEQQL